MSTRTTRPFEQFWPYVEKPERPTDDELAAIDPDLYTALFGPRDLPFSFTLVFGAFEGDHYGRAVDMARDGFPEWRDPKPFYTQWRVELVLKELLRLADNAFIPPDPANRDYAEYLEWVAQGGVPEPAPEPEPVPELTPAEKLAASGLTVEELKTLLGL